MSHTVQYSFIVTLKVLMVGGGGVPPPHHPHTHVHRVTTAHGREGGRREHSGPTPGVQAGASALQGTVHGCGARGTHLALVQAGASALQGQGGRDRATTIQILDTREARGGRSGSPEACTLVSIIYRVTQQFPLPLSHHTHTTSMIVANATAR